MSLTRVSRTFALGLVENNQPERAVELLRPLVESDFASDPGARPRCRGVAAA